MADRNILIRGKFRQVPNYIRVSMGRIEDLEVFDEVFSELYNS